MSAVEPEIVMPAVEPEIVDFIIQLVSILNSWMICSHLLDHECSLSSSPYTVGFPSFPLIILFVHYALKHSIPLLSDYLYG